MRSRTYLNGILTVNAILLGALVWTQLSDRPLLAQAALAAAPGDDEDGRGGGMTTAAEQRRVMIDMLRKLDQSLEASRTLLSSGKVRVQVANIDELISASARAPRESK